MQASATLALRDQRAPFIYLDSLTENAPLSRLSPLSPRAASMGTSLQ